VTSTVAEARAAAAERLAQVDKEVRAAFGA
jgi:hypothetical protein